jgi:hypothetical protein
MVRLEPLRRCLRELPDDLPAAAVGQAQPAAELGGTERQGLRLVKSRRRDPLAIDFGRYRVETSDGVEPAAFASSMGWGLTLDEAEDRLTRRHRD